MSPLLTETPVERFIKTNVSRGDYLWGGRTPYKITIGVVGVPNENAFEGSVCHFATVVSWDMDVCWATEGAKMLKIRDVSRGQCDWYSFDTDVV